MYMCQPVPGMNNINSVIAPLEDTCSGVRYMYSYTTVTCQPVEEQDALYSYVSGSISHSLRNRGDETINFDGPFCEDDDCSDCAK